MRWLPHLEPAERCCSLRGSSNSGETRRKGRGMLFTCPPQPALQLPGEISFLRKDPKENLSLLSLVGT